MTPASLTDRDISRLWSRVDRREPDACWDWTGCVNSDGYGYIGIASRPVGAHRVALIASGVPDDPSLHVLHSCDRPPCCNPAHLRFGTTADNFDDMRRRGRIRNGAACRNAVLTDDLVLEMRRRAAAGEPIAAIARSMGINQNTAYFATTRRSWAHLP